jgi:hypothetical protein
MTDFKTPAFHVAVRDLSNPNAPPVEMDWHEGAGTDASFLDHQYGQEEWERIRIRQKTLDGKTQVTLRWVDNNQVQGEKHELDPNQDLTVSTPAGRSFAVRVTPLPEAEWKVGRSIAFKAPKATIVGRDDGWTISFEPRQLPCVLTIAVESHGIRDEHLPAFAFPSQAPNRYKRGTYFLPKGQFEAAAGGVVRLGVRGAGMSVRVALPEAGESREISPESFKIGAPAQPDMLTEQYVLEHLKSGQAHCPVEYE